MADSEERKVFSQNLRKYMDLKNVDRNKLASDLDVAYTTVQEWYMGTSYPRIDKISAIAKILGVSKSDLIEDENSVFNVGIPILGKIPAGSPLEAVQELYTVDHLKPPKGWKHNVNNYFALRVSGDSMLPEYDDGDIVVFQKNTASYSGKDCCVLIDNDDATFKRVTKNNNGILLEPLNIHNSSGFLPLQLTEEDCVSRSVQILGVAVYRFGKIQYK